MDLAGSDHSSHGRTYSSCCRQRPLIYKRGRCGLLCDSPSKSLQGRHARLRSGGPTPAIVHKKFGKPWACIILQIFQICHSKSSLSQPFSMTNLGNPDCFWSCPDFPILLWKIQPQPAIFRETLIVCDPVQSSQIVHGNSTRSQPFSITNLGNPDCVWSCPDLAKFITKGRRRNTTGMLNDNFEGDPTIWWLNRTDWRVVIYVGWAWQGQMFFNLVSTGWQILHILLCQQMWIMMLLRRNMPWATWLRLSTAIVHY